jgi:hypothetical protein
LKNFQASLQSECAPFVRRSEERQRRISAVASVRQQAERQLATMAEEVALGHRPMPHPRVVELLTKQQSISAFSKKEMTSNSQKYHFFILNRGWGLRGG